MFEFVMPTVGSSGYFQLRAPFDKLILPNERYTCQALRRISDYLANNETPYEDIYEANGASRDDYDKDRTTDGYIVSLQAAIGHWVYVPVRYIAGYPVVNGVPYHSLTLTLALPPMPVEQDLGYIKTGLSSYIKDMLGVTPAVKTVETSKVIQVDKLKSDAEQIKRDLVKNGKTTDRSRYISAMRDLEIATQKIESLENYILTQLKTV